MNIFQTIIMGIIGVCLGSAIPRISDKMILYKISKRNAGTIVPDIKETLFHDLDVRIRCLITITNAGFWIYAGSRLENIGIALLTALLFTITILISVMDLRIRIIPNELVFLMVCLGIPYQLLYFGWQSLLYSVLCMIAVGGLFVLTGKIVGFEQVGAGDIKLAGAIGLILGYPSIKIALIGMSTLLLIFCIGGLATRKLTRHSTFPFAPFMMFGTICTLIYAIDF